MIEPSITASTRRQHIVAAATQVFLRYGYARTTMGDVAEAAGLSRPTLYAAFPKKEEVFEAVIRGQVDAKLAHIRQNISSYPTIAEKLRFACTSWATEGYELVRANPDAKDVFDLAFCSVRESYGAFEGLLTEILEGLWPRGEPMISLPAVVRMVSAAIKGLKDLAQDTAELRGMVASLTELVAARVGTAIVQEDCP